MRFSSMRMSNFRGPCMCGATDCPRCYPDTYMLDPDDDGADREEVGSSRHVARKRHRDSYMGGYIEIGDTYRRTVTLCVNNDEWSSEYGKRWIEVEKTLVKRNPNNVHQQ